ncbi:MAG: DUF6515 family protein [Planctomycetota bacterium]
MLKIEKVLNSEKVITAIAVVSLTLLICSSANGQRYGRYQPRGFHGPPPRTIRGPSLKLGQIKISLPKPAINVAVPPARFYYSLPRGYVRVNIGGVTYYQLGSTYFRQLPYQGKVVYVQAEPSISTDISHVSPTPKNDEQAASRQSLDHMEQIIVDGKTYYRPRETSATRNAHVPPDSKKITQVKHSISHPEIGTTVDSLPRGAKRVVFGTTTYYTANQAFYLPIRVGYDEKFVVVEMPRQ